MRHWREPATTRKARATSYACDTSLLKPSMEHQEQQEAQNVESEDVSEVKEKEVCLLTFSRIPFSHMHAHKHTNIQ
jgi:hypothetical protein